MGTRKAKRTVRFDIPDAAAHTALVETFLARRLKRSKQAAREMFLPNYGLEAPIDEKSASLLMRVKIGDEYARVKNMAQSGGSKSTKHVKPIKSISSFNVKEPDPNSLDPAVLANVIKSVNSVERPVAKLVEESKNDIGNKRSRSGRELVIHRPSGGLVQRAPSRIPKPEWHPPWVLTKVLSGHQGWVRSVAVDVSNEWFVTGSDDRTIKIWDLASGNLKLTLTGHISAITGLCVSPRHPYMFSVGDDKTVRCWDLEQNKVIRSYHGHLSGVYNVDIHPTIDIIVTCGRDSTARVWDIRTKAQVMVLTGHSNTVGVVKCQASEPQIISGSYDSTIRLWDLKVGRASAVLTNHKKSVRDLILHSTEYTFCSGSSDNLKVWACPQGRFLRNISGGDAIVNTLSINADNVLVSGANEGTLKFWDWKTGYCFQSYKAPPQPGSLESECGIYDSAFDQTGSRLITCEADKTIKIWKEDDEATEESHPISSWKPKRKRKRY